MSITATQAAALTNCYHQAKASNHIWPAYAACEAAVETGWFTSQCYLQGNNLFGTKQHVHPIFGTFNMPTREFLGGVWKVIEASWVKYPTLADSFSDRMATLRALSIAKDPHTGQPVYPHYLQALAALNGADFVTWVSLTWSTGPSRGSDVLQVYNAHRDLLV